MFGIYSAILIFIVGIVDICHNGIRAFNIFFILLPIVEAVAFVVVQIQIKKKGLTAHRSMSTCRKAGLVVESILLILITVSIVDQNVIVNKDTNEYFNAAYSSDEFFGKYTYLVPETLKEYFNIVDESIVYLEDAEKEVESLEFATDEEKESFILQKKAEVETILNPKLESSQKELKLFTRVLTVLTVLLLIAKMLTAEVPIILMEVIKHIRNRFIYNRGV